MIAGSRRDSRRYSCLPFRSFQTALVRCFFLRACLQLSLCFAMCTFRFWRWLRARRLFANALGRFRSLLLISRVILRRWPVSICQSPSFCHGRPRTPGTVPHWTNRHSDLALAPPLVDSLLNHLQFHSEVRIGCGIDATWAARRTGELDRRNRHGVEEGLQQTEERSETFRPQYNENGRETEQKQEHKRLAANMARSPNSWSIAPRCCFFCLASPLTSSCLRHTWA